MRVIPPLTITDSMLTSSNVTETPPALWDAGTLYALNDQCGIAGAAGLITIYESLIPANFNYEPTANPSQWELKGTTYQLYDAGTTYALGDKVLSASTHRIYESLSAGNLGNAVTDATKWLEIGVSNKWAMFDLKRSSTTSNEGNIAVTITPGVRVDSVGLFGLVADSVSVVMTVSAVEEYNYSTVLYSREVTGWYDYFFEPFGNSPSVLLIDLPLFANGVITITITSNTALPAECGACVLGRNTYLGAVQYDAESDVLNFSTVTRDFAGDISTMVPRRNVPRTIQQIWADTADLKKIILTRDALAGTPAVWAGIDGTEQDYFDSLLILGFYKKFSINAKYPEKAIISLELEEI